MLVEMIYASKPSGVLNQAITEDILRVARSRNGTRDLTGLLVLNRQFFLQLIEGDREHVNQLLCKLVADPRHTDFHMISFKRIEQRSFAQWGMGFVAANALNKSVLLRNGVSSSFNPYTMSEASVRELLNEMRAEATIG